MTLGYFPYAEIPALNSAGPGNGKIGRSAIDDFKYLSGANEIEQLLHGWSGIEQAYCSLAVAGQIADYDHCAQARAIYERRLR